MAPTTESKVQSLLLLPWTIDVQRDDDGSFIAKVAELPSVVATGATEKDLERDLWASLRATIECYLHFGDPIPLPRGMTQLPWESRRGEPRLMLLVKSERGDVWEQTPEATSTLTSDATPRLAAV